MFDYSLVILNDELVFDYSLVILNDEIVPSTPPPLLFLSFSFVSIKFKWGGGGGEEVSKLIVRNLHDTFWTERFKPLCGLFTHKVCSARQTRGAESKKSGCFYHSLKEIPLGMTNENHER